MGPVVHRHLPATTQIQPPPLQNKGTIMQFMYQMCTQRP